MDKYLDWRTIAVSACGVVFVLVGVLGRWGLDYLNRESAINDKQWESIRELTNEAVINKERVSNLQARMNYLEQRR